MTTQVFPIPLLPVAFAFSRCWMYLQRASPITKPIPRWNVHFGILKMTERAPRLLISPLAPNWGRPLQCGLEICTSHLGFSLVLQSQIENG